MSDEPTDAEVEAKARDIYLRRYGAMGGRWELVETKDVWRDQAREWFRHDEGTRPGSHPEMRP